MELPRKFLITNTNFSEGFKIIHLFSWLSNMQFLFVWFYGATNNYVCPCLKCHAFCKRTVTGKWTNSSCERQFVMFRLSSSLIASGALLAWMLLRWEVSKTYSIGIVTSSPSPSPVGLRDPIFSNSSSSSSLVISSRPSSPVRNTSSSIDYSRVLLGQMISHQFNR